LNRRRRRVLWQVDHGEEDFDFLDDRAVELDANALTRTDQARQKVEASIQESFEPESEFRKRKTIRRSDRKFRF
jgi:hypothetical protein